MEKSQSFTFVALVALGVMLFGCTQNTPNPTLTPTVTATATLEPNQNPCGWCGLECVLIRPEMSCIAIAPPQGRACVPVNNQCTNVPSPTPTG